MYKGIDKWNLFIKYKPCLARKSASVMGQPCNNSPTGALILTGNLLLCVLKSWWQLGQNKLLSYPWKISYHSINPLTPVLPITGRDKPWPFFHFWCHHFWPKLTSSILNFCRMNRSFQWCPDQSDRPKGTWDMHKNVQRVERKTQTKISCLYTSTVKIARLYDTVLEVF